MSQNHGNNNFRPNNNLSESEQQQQQMFQYFQMLSNSMPGQFPPHLMNQSPLPPHFFPQTQYFGGHNMTQPIPQNYVSPMQQSFPSQSSQTNPNTNLNILNDETIVEETVVENSPARRGGKNSFTVKEDEVLISAYIRISEDNTIGTGQNRKSFWNRVKGAYDEGRQCNSGIRERNVSMLTSRWSRIAAGVSTWVGFWDQAYRRRKSGMSDDDIMLDAISLAGGRSNFEHCWTILKKANFQKWDEIVSYTGSEKRGKKQVSVEITNLSDDESGGSGKRVRLNSGGFSTPSSADGESGSKRPMGIKAAKNKGKLKLSQNITNFSESINNLAGITERDNEIELRRLKYLQDKEERKRRELDWQILQNLIQCQNLDAEGEALKMSLYRKFQQ